VYKAQPISKDKPTFNYITDIFFWSVSLQKFTLQWNLSKTWVKSFTEALWVQDIALSAHNKGSSERYIS